MATGKKERPGPSSLSPGNRKLYEALGHRLDPIADWLDYKQLNALMDAASEKALRNNS
jgi:hypothetical protein